MVTRYACKERQDMGVEGHVPVESGAIWVNEE